MSSPPPAPEGRPTLESWKEIARYLGRGVTTVQRWEKEEGLPVRRHPHRSLGSVYAYPEELDTWRARRSQTAAAPARPAPASQPARRLLWAAASLVPVLAAAGVWLHLTRPADPPQPGRSFPLASEPAIEHSPSLSPDGLQAVYAARSNGPCGAARLYVKPVDRGEARLLTSLCAEHYWPKWSPDGSLIAYTRQAGPKDLELCVVPPAGGPERVVARLAGAVPVAPSFDQHYQVAWAPGKAVIVSERPSPTGPFALYRVDLDTRVRRQLTFPPSGATGDSDAAMSPDGRTLAFARWPVTTEADLFVTSLDGGAARRLTFDNLPIRGVAWTPDGRELIFSSQRLSPFPTLWRLPLSGARFPSRAGGAANLSVRPATAALAGGNGFRLAYQSGMVSVNISRWKPTAGPTAEPEPACPSSHFDWHAQLSPTGDFLAFVSNRGGSSNVWLCEPGGRARQVTRFPDAYVDSVRWSPDGRRILFTSRNKESRDVFLADLESRRVRALIHDPADDGRASFSRDGNWVYFRSNRSGRNEIWKMSASGGPARQITRTGAMEGFESPNGSLLYFVKERPTLGVWSIPTEGGPETPVLDGVQDSRWAVARDGIYFTTLKPPFEILRYRFDTRRTESVYRIRGAAAMWAGFTVSYDGGIFAWPQTVRDSSDILILDFAGS